MSILKGIFNSDLEMVKKYVERGDEINLIFNTYPPSSLLEIAMHISSEKNSPESSKSIVTYMKDNDAVTYDEFMKRPPVINMHLPPLYKKTVLNKKRNFTSGITLASRGGYSKRNRKLRRTRKIR